MIISIFEISNAGGSIDMKLLSDGLYTAMTTTVAGLVVELLIYMLQSSSCKIMGSISNASIVSRVFRFANEPVT